jgi:hypothetical protein
MAAKTGKKSLYTVVMQHDGTAEARMKTVDDYEKAAQIAHKFFLSYFRFENGKMIDDGHDDNKRDGGEDVFSDVKIYKGKYVVEFTHCEGDGPVCRIEKTGSL